MRNTLLLILMRNTLRRIPVLILNEKARLAKTSLLIKVMY